MLPGGLIFPLDPGFGSSKGSWTYPLKDRVESTAKSRETLNLGHLGNEFSQDTFLFNIWETARPIPCRFCLPG